MNLLLLLSALLSALSGVGQVVRGARAPQVVCVAVVVGAATSVRRTSLPMPPAAVLPRFSGFAAQVLAAFGLMPAEAPFASRRRE